ncbi:MAG: GNAT family N-acetyltransferase [Bacteroidota bacterium]
MLRIEEATTPEAHAMVTRLFRSYSVWCIEQFIARGMVPPDDARLLTFNDEAIPGAYATGRSLILLARHEGEPAGCAFLREIDASRCEMKRLYVDPGQRGKRVGVQLLEALLHRARELDYRYLRISSHSEFMGKAVALYRSCGFYDIPNYLDDPLQAGDTHMEYDLRQPDVPNASHWPAFIDRQPSAQLPFSGVRSRLLQAGDHQVVFMAFDRDMEIPEHAHGAQWGVVLAGEMQLTINGKARTLQQGDTYYIEDRALHSARIKRGYRDLTLFADPDRYHPNP